MGKTIKDSLHDGTMMPESHHNNKLNEMMDRIGEIHPIPGIRERYFSKYRSRLIKDAIDRGDLDELRWLSNLKFPSERK